MGPVGQKISRMSIVEYILAYHDRYEYRISWLSYFTQKKVVTSNVGSASKNRPVFQALSADCQRWKRS